MAWLHLSGNTPVWDMPVSYIVGFGLDWLLVTFIPFVLALAIHNTAVRVVVYLFGPNLLGMLGLNATPREIISYLNVSDATAKTLLYVGSAPIDSLEWVKLATSVTVWLIIPGIIGLWRSLRREVN